MAATAPVRVAVISAVSPPGSVVLGSTPASSRRRIRSALPFWHGEIQRRDAVAVLRGRVGAGPQQRVRHVESIGVDRGVQRGQAVHARGVDVGLLCNQGANGGKVAAGGRVHERRTIRGCRVRGWQHGGGDRGGREESPEHGRILAEVSIRPHRQQD